jgi:hypothetical protein
MSIARENTSTNETQEFSIDPVINRKIKSAIEGLQPSIQKYFLEFPTEKDKELVADFTLFCVQSKSKTKEKEKMKPDRNGDEQLQKKIRVCIMR